MGNGVCDNTKCFVGTDLCMWLLSLDDGSGKLLQYHEPLKAKCASLHEMRLLYSTGGHNGGFDVERFCHDLGFKKVVHRRFVERWAAAAPAMEASTLGPLSSEVHSRVDKKNEECERRSPEGKSSEQTTKGEAQLHPIPD